MKDQKSVNNRRRENFIERTLEYLESAPTSWGITPGRPPRQKVGPFFFDGAEPFYMPSESHDLSKSDGYQGAVFFSDVPPNLVYSRLHITVLCSVWENDEPTGELHFTRIQNVSLRDVRGRAQRILPYPVEQTTGWLHEKKVAQMYMGYVGKFQWRSMVKGDPAVDKMASDKVQVAMGIVFTMDYQWRVYLAHDDKPGLTLPTDPIGAAAFFRLRDIPEGRSRRAALRNWVTDHWRANRNDPQEEIKVRKHLRGAVNFDWHGIHGAITPSLYDQQQAARFMEEREQLRQTGLDRRPAE